MKQDMIDILHSWTETEHTVNSMESLLEWIDRINEKVTVNINETSLEEGDFWFFNPENGYIENTAKQFFSLKGLRFYQKGILLTEQPVIDQPEIGYLGIICKKIQGVMHFLMQAKIEPGNINCVQISPTIQATKSNFEQVHGGKQPAYLQYFQNAGRHTILLDQVQSEQGSRFYKKRNRNIMIRVDEEIEVLDSFRWMTLGQIKQLMKIDNLVNMDARTVLSCIPFSTYQFSDRERQDMRKKFGKDELFLSMFQADIQEGVPDVYNYLNNLRMFQETETELVPLTALKDWTITDKGMFCKNEANFDIRHFDIEISGREVRYWRQPLLCASGIGIFGLFVSIYEGTYYFLIKVKTEVGNFDTAELGPTVFREPVDNEDLDEISKLFFQQLQDKHGVISDGLFSEEGGRFYHEQNRNIILLTEFIPQRELPPGYFWMSYASLNALVQVNNCLNIQLRNLLSILDQ